MTLVKTLFFLCCCLVGAASFLLRPEPFFRHRILLASNNNGDNASSWNPLKELTDMLSSFDDVVDDFVNKRMGNGEIFYGQRKYKPSGRENTSGSYTGMGMSDKARIDAARAYKAEMMEMRRLREQGLNQEK